MQTIDFWASTHQGRTRTHNEDRYLWLTPEDTEGNGHLWVVCDGMGGEAGGARAAQVVIERFREVYPPTLKNTASPHEALKETLQAANRRLLYLASEDSALAGMGSTVAAVALYRDRLWVASVGDSRVYGWTPSGLLQWTVDHSKYEKMREHGVISPEDERSDHPARHVLMNVVGRDKMFVDTLNDRHFVTTDCALLICSDGLSGSVLPKELRVAFASLDARDATRFLMSAALPRSQDNITLQVVRFTPPITPRPIEEVAASFGVTLIEPRTEGALSESGQSITYEVAPDVAAPPTKASPPAEAVEAKPTERPKRLSASVPITTKQGETVLLSPDALSNVFGSTSSDGADAVEEVSKRVTAAGGTVMLSPDALSKALEEHGVSGPKDTRTDKGTIMLSPDALSKALGEGSVATDKGTIMLSPDALSKALEEGSVTTEKGTIMLSPDALSKALEEHGVAVDQPSAPPRKGGQTPGAKISGAKGAEAPSPRTYSSAPIGVLGKGSSSDLEGAERDADASKLSGEAARAEARRRLAEQSLASDDALRDEDAIVERTAFKYRWIYTLIALFVLLIIIAGVLLWKPDTPEAPAPLEPESSKSDDAQDAQDALKNLPPRQLPEYAFAEQRGAPDVVHAMDRMPAYAVLDGTLLIDAHEATAGQFARVRDAISERGGDYSMLQTVACLGKDDAYTQDAERQPACVTPLGAAAYCDAVGRRLPQADEWNAIVEAEPERIGRGYGKLFSSALDGPPPSLPERVDSILGVYDGLPEFLHANEAQVRHGDLVLLAPTGTRVTRGEPSGMERFESKDTPSDQMLGVRCISDHVEQEAEERPAKVRPPAAQRRPAPAASAPAPSDSEDVSVGRVAPRVDAPDEAPIDPDIPDRSRIIEYMKKK